MRLFIALWPDAATRAALARWQRRWSWPEHAAPVRPERLHLTLHFLGSVPCGRLADLIDLLPVPREAISLDFGSADLWPGGIAIVRPLAVPPALARLHAALASCVSSFGLTLDPRPYQPHVTLARHAMGARPPPPGPRIRWQCGSGYVLVQSLPAGAGYEVLQRLG